MVVWKYIYTTLLLHNQRNRLNGLPWIEYWLNMTFQEATSITPFKALRDCDPPTVVKFIGEPFFNEEVTT